MTEHQLIHMQQGSFQAARQLAGDDAPMPHQRRHGHGFKLIALAQEPTDADALARAVATVCGALNYQDLNACLATGVDDRSLLQHFQKALSAHALTQLQLETEPGLVSSLYVSDTPWTTVAKTYFFEAAHQLPNVPVGHKCGRMHGHGFSVRIEIKGDDPADLYRPLEALHQGIDDAWAPLADTLNWACLNDIPGLENPTSEHLAVWLWARLEGLAGLVSVGVNETPSAGCVFNGQGMRIWKEQTFDSAVQLANAKADDPRRAIHGHTFRVRLHLQGPLDEVLGWVYDFGDVKRAFSPLFEALDHQPLHSIKGLEHADDATVAGYIYRHMKPILPRLCRVDIEHRPNCGAKLMEVDRPNDL